MTRTSRLQSQAGKGRSRAAIKQLMTPLVYCSLDWIEQDVFVCASNMQMLVLHKTTKGQQPEHESVNTTECHLNIICLCPR